MDVKLSSGSQRERIAVLVLYGFVIFIPLALSAVLLFTAETFAGRIFAVDALLLLALPVSLGHARYSTSRKRFYLPAALATVFVALFVTLRLLVPAGPAAASRPGPATYYPMAPYRPWALSSLLPEIDQLKLGTYFVALGDPILDRDGAAKLRASVLGVYRPMEQDAAFRALGSAMTYAYSDDDSGHYYEYIPAGAPRERPPVVVFLHGSAGNFKGYLYVWKNIADAGSFIVVAPSFGFGNWQRPGGVEAIERARMHALRDLGADPGRIYLAGLSNGGRGVTRAIAAQGGGERKWAGVLLLSAVIEPEIARGAPGFRGMPVLVVHGKRDDRIPWAYLEKSLDALRSAGANVIVETDPDEDHFLFFSRAAEVQGWVGEWLRGPSGVR
jgi:pimeloyl-ACP methyl ester carboxylesterase